MNNSNYLLRRAVLSGFRTIQDVDIDFKEGLSIIIGKNGTGKSNFLLFIYYVLTLNIKELPKFEAELYYNFNNIHYRTVLKNILPASKNKNQLLLQSIFKLFKGNQKISEADDKSDFIINYSKNKIEYNTALIRHGIPKDYLIVQKPLSFKIDNTYFSHELLKIIFSEAPVFTRGLIFKILSSISKLRKSKDVVLNEILNSEIEEIIKNLLIDKLDISENLAKYSNIKNLRVSDNANFSLDVDKMELSVSNLFLEFYVNGQWLPYNNLSDGTKRIFYIISEVSASGGYTFNLQSFGERPYTTSVLVLLEEPELGLHPHQLDKLMQFLRESSNDKQIVITTHSPDVLDVLEKEELNKIIIASIDSGETHLRKMNKAEISKAESYLESEIFISDYWKYSDLDE